jgi:hypothetical protein
MSRISSALPVIVRARFLGCESVQLKTKKGREALFPVHQVRMPEAIETA